jgi:ribosome-associated toxin RatA of RatAB toxin-antitoxin module
MIEQATERVMVKASPQRCYEVATDFDAYPEWSSDIKKVDVIERDGEGRGRAVRFWAEAMGRSTQYTLQYDYSNAPSRLSWTLTEGDIERRLDGEYFFETVDEQTEMTYHLVVELRVPMPGFVKRRAEGRILGAALQELKARAES